MINVLVKCSTGIEIPNVIPDLVHYIVLFIKIGIPIVLIVMGMLDLGKAVIGKDEKEMKEAQNKLIHRVVYAVLIFLITSIVTWVVSILSTSTTGSTAADGGLSATDKSSITSCINCFINGSKAPGCN